MKILFFARLYWPHKGGVEKHVEMLSERLLKRGHSVEIITEQSDPNLPETEVFKDVKIWRIPYFALSSKLSLWSWMEQHIHLVDNADVVHVHDVFWWYWPIWLMRPLRSSYLTFHGYEGSGPPTKKAIVLRKLSELAARKSICIGDFMKKWYLARPNLVLYGAASIKKNTTNIKKKTAVFYGRFDYDTGIDMYVAAAKKILELESVDIYGDGPLLELIKENTRSKKIKLYPWKSDVESLLLSRRYAFVSRYLSILEAMQAKRLVVAVYNNKIKKDYLECHPMSKQMIIAGSEAELVKKMKSLWQDEKRENEMIDKAYKWAHQQTWDALTDEYLRLWK